MQKRKAKWQKRTKKGQRIIERNDYYRDLLKNYKPSETGLSQTLYVVCLNKIHMGDSDGGGEAIRTCLHFLLQNKVTSCSFEAIYNLALEYVLNSLVSGKVHYGRNKERTEMIKTKADVEQLMLENLKGSRVNLSVKEFMKKYCLQSI